MDGQFDALSNLVNLGFGSLGFGPVNPPYVGPIIASDVSPSIFGSSFGSVWVGSVH